MEYLYMAKVLIVVFSAALVQSIVGFGYALLAAPLLTLIMGPKEMVVFLLFSGLYLRFYMFYRVHKEVVMADIKYLILGNILGIIPGIYILKVINVPMFKLFIGVVLLISVLLINFQFKWKSKSLTFDGLLFGFFSGFLGSSTSVSGPPIVLYMLNTFEDKAKIRTTMITFFTFGTIITLLGLFIAGTFKPSAALGLPIYSIPFVMLAAKIGERIFYHMNQKVFRRLVILLILISSLALLYGGYRGL